MAHPHGPGTAAPAAWTVCGIDYGSPRSPSYVAWLTQDGVVTFDLYVPDDRGLLPPPPTGLAPAAVYAVDAPQGLPARGTWRRACDALAHTPTQRLPDSREGLAALRLYGPFVRGGVDLFWGLVAEGEARLVGLPGEDPELPLLCETHPRRVLRTGFGLLPRDIPSKRREAAAYVQTVWQTVTAQGIVCPGVIHPSVDQADALLCALAARSLAEAQAQGTGLPAGSVGAPPTLDREERVVREGWIIAP